jgi:hypothetical protein
MNSGSSFSIRMNIVHKNQTLQELAPQTQLVQQSWYTLRIAVFDALRVTLEIDGQQISEANVAMPTMPISLRGDANYVGNGSGTKSLAASGILDVAYIRVSRKKTTTGDFPAPAFGFALDLLKKTTTVPPCQSDRDCLAFNQVCKAYRCATGVFTFNSAHSSASPAPSPPTPPPPPPVAPPKDTVSATAKNDAVKSSVSSETVNKPKPTNNLETTSVKSCQNGGVSQVDGSCQCPDDYEGSNCETQKSKGLSTGLIIAICCVVGVGVVMIAGALVWKHRRDATKPPLTAPIRPIQSISVPQRPGKGALSYINHLLIF